MYRTTAIKEGIYRIRSHEPSGINSAENLARAMELELALLLAEIGMKSFLVEKRDAAADAMNKARDLLGANLNHDMGREERQRMNFVVWEILNRATEIKEDE